jgi:hypothetical protein
MRQDTFHLGIKEYIFDHNLIIKESKIAASPTNQDEYHICYPKKNDMTS